MTIQRTKSSHPGVRYREHKTRLHNGKPDRYFTIYYKLKGKFYEEALGWASQGWTEAKAAIERNKLKQAHATGEGPQTLNEKRDLAAERKAEKEAQKVREAKEALTFTKFFTETYAPHSLTSKSKKSTDREDQLFRLWISPVIGDLPFKKISALQLNQIRSNMLEKGIAPRSVTYAFAVIRQVFNYAKFCHMSELDSPTQRIQMPKFDNQRKRFLSPDEAAILLKALKEKSEQVYEISIMSFECGLRANEIFSLKWKDIDLENEIITIFDSKNSKSRPAFMTENVKNMLLSKKQGDKNDLIFVGREGVKISQISRTFRIVVDELGLNNGVSDPRQKLVFHTLRHTYASWLAMDGTDIYMVKELMGHSSLAMTQRYAHLGNGALRKAAKKLDGKIDLDMIN
ncbi:tyrosine-type recombinase/integrase [Fundidesulfovibrio soli]|uniref:tyrosine-type recombinase/integrase n=1 Tax=Fundidesulfovibrio soli TaxID=2922716 RepID=UPI001FAFEE56|nr:site-specific integrase [Fundidesulfovibrio soli]